MTLKQAHGKAFLKERIINNLEIILNLIVQVGTVERRSKQIGARNIEDLFHILENR